MSLLRPIEYVEANKLAPGVEVDLHMIESHLSGRYTVASIEPSPTLASGSGGLVTGVFSTPGQRLQRLWLRGSAEPIESTANHPIYSLDRQAYVPAGALKPGERLAAATPAGFALVDRIEPLEGLHRVHNLEIQGEHRYLVSSLGVLAHNDCNGEIVQKNEPRGWEQDPRAAGRGKRVSKEPTVDPATGEPIGRFVATPEGPVMIEPVGGRTVQGPAQSPWDTHTTYRNGSNYHRYNPKGHANNPTPHGHGHGPGTGPGMRGQGPSLDPSGRPVPFTSPDAHWPLGPTGVY